MDNTISGSTPAYGATDTASQSPLTGGNANLANENTFMTLLVAQLKNQDPLNPMDGTQFVSQLAQFSELEQVIQIRQDADKVAGIVPASGSSTSAPAGGN